MIAVRQFGKSKKINLEIRCRLDRPQELEMDACLALRTAGKNVALNERYLSGKPVPSMNDPVNPSGYDQFVIMERELPEQTRRFL